MSDPDVVEAELVAYYDAEGDARTTRPMDPRRVDARSSFVASLAPASRVLEIGSGPGRDAIAFVQAGHAHVAVDLSMEHARRCLTTGAGVVRASVRHLPFPAEAFDAMWTMSTLMHVPDAAIDGVLAEIARVLRPGATAGIGVWGGPDVEDYGPEAPAAGELRRLFSRRSDDRWRTMLATIGTVEDFESWTFDDDFRYQWAVVRRTSRS